MIPRPDHPVESTDLADVIAAAATSVPGVTRLHPGPFGEVSTYLPGRRVDGVRIRSDLVEIHVAIAMGTPVLPVAAAVRSSVAPLVTAPIEVFVEDMDTDLDG